MAKKKVYTAEADEVIKGLGVSKRLILNTKMPDQVGWRGGDEATSGIYQTPKGDLIVAVNPVIPATLSTTTLVYPTRMKKKVEREIEKVKKLRRAEGE